MRSPRRTIASSAALILVGVLSACSTEQPAQDGAPATQATATADSNATTTGGEVDGAHNEADTMFAQMMIVHHQGAIEMADLAVQQAGSEEVRSLAEGISAAQGPEIEQMRSWLTAWGEATTPAGGAGHMDHGGMQMEGMTQEEAMAELEGLSGAEFDTRFLELMIAHHQGAVQMAQEELDEGRNPQARELAQQVIEDQEAEITQMQDMLEQS